MAGLQAGAQWPMVGYCGSRVNRSPHPGPSAPTAKWKFFPDAGYLETEPVIAADGTIFVATNLALHAVSPAGAELWKFPFPAMTYYTIAPAIGANDVVYVGAEDYLYARNVADGTEVFSLQLPGPVDADNALAIAQDGAILVAGDVAAWAVEPAGTLRWTYDLFRGDFAVAPGGDVALAGNRGLDAYLASVDPLTGVAVWEIAPGNAKPDFPDVMVAADGTLHLYEQNGSDANGELWLYDAAGAFIWGSSAAETFSARPALYDDRALAVGIGLFEVSGQSAPTMLRDFAVGQPAFDRDGNSYVMGRDANLDEHLYAFDPAGNELWKVNDGSYFVIGSPAIAADGTIYFSHEALSAIGD